MICTLDNNDYCERHKCKHVGKLKTLALDPSEKGEAYRRVWDDARIECMTGARDRDKLRSMSKGNVLEIGTFVGGTTVTLSHNAKHVVTVDAFTGDHDGSIVRADYVFADQLAKAKGNLAFLGDKVTILKYDTLAQRDELRQRLTEIGLKYDFVFIDGNHDYEHVRNDIQIAKEFLADGGTIAGHDIQMDGVSRAVKEEFGTVFKLTAEPGNDGKGSLWWTIPKGGVKAALPRTFRQTTKPRGCGKCRRQKPSD